MSWLSLFTGVLKLAALIGEIMRDRQLLDAGEQRQIAKSLQGVADAVGLAVEIDKQVDAMSDDEINAALEEDFRE